MSEMRECVRPASALHTCLQRCVVLLALVGLGCSGEADVSEAPPGVDLEAPSPDFTDEDMPDLDLGGQMELALVEYPVAIARLETQLPNLSGLRRAQLESAITELGSLMSQLKGASARWSEANPAEREGLTSDVEALLDELDASLIRAESLLGPETT